MLDPDPCRELLLFEQKPLAMQRLVGIASTVPDCKHQFVRVLSDAVDFNGDESAVLELRARKEGGKMNFAALA